MVPNITACVHAAALPETQYFIHVSNPQFFCGRPKFVYFNIQQVLEIRVQDISRKIYSDPPNSAEQKHRHLYQSIVI